MTPKFKSWLDAWKQAKRQNKPIRIQLWNPRKNQWVTYIANLDYTFEEVKAI